VHEHFRARLRDTGSLIKSEPSLNLQIFKVVLNWPSAASVEMGITNTFLELSQPSQLSHGFRGPGPYLIRLFMVVIYECL